VALVGPKQEQLREESTALLHKIKAEATAGTFNSAFLVFRLCHTKTIKLPIPISTAANDGRGDIA